MKIEKKKKKNIDFITRQIKLKLNLDKKRNKLTWKIIERCYDEFKLGTIYLPDEFQSYTKPITESDKGP